MARKAGSHADITGPAIREVAQRLFAHSGYAAVSMRQIAAEVGVGVGALYLYTPDKQTLLFDLMRDHMSALLDAWEATDKGETPEAQLQAFVSFHIDFHIDRPDAVFLAYMELRNLTPENFAVIEALRRQYEDHLQDILTLGQEAGAFHVEDARVITMALIAMLAGIHVWYRDGGRLSRDRIQTLYLELVRRTVSP
ncbi:MAG: TetR/AcrR family transcriptional regulator [Boseongicola sp.]|nr:TetR/AcrR family transcriptional regulator [Boseongicola sp.]NNL18510.1 TetR/AcrR family transcriptional regulator [Boseongicola sp.]